MINNQYVHHYNIRGKNLQDMWSNTAQQMFDSTLDDAGINNTLPQITQCSLPLKHWTELNKHQGWLKELLNVARPIWMRENMSKSHNLARLYQQSTCNYAVQCTVPKTIWSVKPHFKIYSMELWAFCGLNNLFFDVYGYFLSNQVTKHL